MTQIRKLSSDIPNRSIKLKPYGLVFWKDELLKRGANPAIYINAKGTELEKYLLNEFRKQFETHKTFNKLKMGEEEYYNEIIQYYSLINIIDSKHDFSWEREWRFHGDLKFEYKDIAAIIAQNPDNFMSLCENEFKGINKLKKVKRIPIIDPNWNYEEVIEEMSYKIWNI